MAAGCGAAHPVDAILVKVESEASVAINERMDEKSSLETLTGAVDR